MKGGVINLPFLCLVLVQSLLCDINILSSLSGLESGWINFSQLAAGLYLKYVLVIWLTLNPWFLATNGISTPDNTN